MTGNEVMKYTSQGQEVLLTVNNVKKYLTTNPSVTDEEVVMFMKLCQYRGLNPWLKEAYLVKYGGTPAQIIVGKDAFTSRAAYIPECEGWSSGVIYMDNEHNVHCSKGMLLTGCKLIGGWAEVYRKGWREPLRIELNLEERIGRNKEGEISKSWLKMPCTLIAKCALVAVLREAFSDVFGQMYIKEEMNAETDEIDIPSEVVSQNTRISEQEEKFRCQVDLAKSLKPAAGKEPAEPEDRSWEAGITHQLKNEPEDRSWEAKALEALKKMKGKPLAGFEDERLDIIKNIKTLSQDEVKLRAYKLHFLQDVVKGEEDAFAKSIIAAKNMDDIQACLLEKWISDATKKLLEIAHVSDKKDVILKEIDRIGKGKNRKQVLASLENYEKQLSGQGQNTPIEEDIY